VAGPKPDKQAIIQSIADKLIAHGGTVDIESFRKKHFSKLPRSSFYRYLQTAKVIAGQAEASKTIETAQALAQQVDDTVSKVLPVVVTPDAINPIANTSAVALVHECIGYAREALAFCRTAEGKIRNLKGFLQGVNAILSAVNTLSRVAERLMDAQKIEAMHAAMFEEIRKADPETAERIVKRLRALKDSWGMS
jgi:hypothetical protein